MTNSSKETPALIVSLAFTIAAILGGFWWLNQGNFFGNNPVAEPDELVLRSSPDPDAELDSAFANVTDSSSSESNPERVSVVEPEPTFESASEPVETTERTTSVESSSDSVALTPLETYQKIRTHLDKSDVYFEGENGRNEGEVTKTLIRDSSDANESGAIARVKWDDQAISSILFRSNNRVRLWEEGNEYGGRWSWSPGGTLQIRMDKGASFRFVSED